ncbi:hypothetical protein [Atlantibacter hermannii]|uniref:hypothetical protein n=1 Tax=Atlantibacter hermannii TaxID=565 RepID=UPI0028AACA27|nr:hypothetical protein [Atlantibacter hermannii]
MSRSVLVPKDSRVANEEFNVHTLNTGYDGGSGGGDGMIEARVAKLEADVENIKTNLAETRADVRELTKNYASIKTDVSVLLQKTTEIDSALAKRPTADAMKVWFLTILLFSVAMPIITLLINLYLKKP